MISMKAYLTVGTSLAFQLGTSFFMFSISKFSVIICSFLQNFISLSVFSCADYLELALQFGIVVMFASFFPLVAVLALLVRRLHSLHGSLSR